MGTNMTSKERVARTLAHQQPDRVPIYDKFWFETETQFRRDIPLPRDEDDGSGNTTGWGKSPAAESCTLWEYFDMDLCEVAWPDYRLRFTLPEVIEETDEWITQRDGNWAVLRWWKNKMGTPEHVEFGINTPEKWAEVKHLITAGKHRVRWDEFKPLYRRGREQNRFMLYATVEPFEMIKDVLGHEIMLRSMMKRPEWIHDIFRTYTEVAVRMLELTEAEGMVCDGAFVYGDMAYNTGPFMSPKHYREFLYPYHKRMMDEFHKRNMPVLYHSDGDLRMVLDDLISAGVNAINPLEVKANMDLREIAPKFGDRLGFCGGIDARILATNDLDQIREEIRVKMGAAMPHRGYIYHSDHSVLPDTSLATYRAVLDEVKRVGTYQ